MRRERGIRRVRVVRTVDRDQLGEEVGGLAGGVGDGGGGEGVEAGGVVAGAVGQGVSNLQEDEGHERERVAVPNSSL